MITSKLMPPVPSSALSFTFVGANAVTTGTGISVTTGTQTGDLLVAFDRPISMTASLLGGFTSVGTPVSTVRTTGYTLSYGYRIAQAGDSSFTSASSRKILMAFRPSRSISSVSVSGFTSNGAATSPKTVSTTANGVGSISFMTVTHSTGTVGNTPSANAIEPNTANGTSLQAWYGINASTSLTSTDSSSDLMVIAAFVLTAT